jgi:hypothetical protein
VVSGNRISNTIGQGIAVGGAALYGSVTGNELLLTGNAVGLLGETLRGSSFPPQNVTFANNNVTGGAYGMQILDCSYLTVTGNTSTLAAFSGFYVSGSTAQASSYCTFSGNVARAGAGTGFQFAAGVAGGVSGLAVTGNVAAFNSGIGFTSNAYCANLTFTGNVSLSNGAPQYSLLGTGIQTAGNA